VGGLIATKGRDGDGHELQKRLPLAVKPCRGRSRDDFGFRLRAIKLLKERAGLSLSFWRTFAGNCRRRRLNQFKLYWNQKRRRSTPSAAKNRREDWRKSLSICGAGRKWKKKPQKGPVRVVGTKQIENPD
jgi:hypothetical protein